MKHLLTRLCGDYDWVPGERLLGENDIELFSDDLLARILPREPAALDVNAAKQERTNGETAAHAESGSTQPGQAESSGAAPKERSSTEAEQKNGSGESGSLEETATKSDPDASVAGQKDEPPDARGPDGAEKAPEQSTDAEQVKEDKNGTSPAHANGVGSEMDVDPPTEAPAADKVAAEDSASSPAQTMDETPEEPLIHPYFLAPPSARPDKDLGLPEQEADDVRRLLQMYVQKQEEICRGMRRLHEGLLRADRLRRTVLKWSKAEAHVGPNRDMSDGEDWYDKEEWGLEEDLKKGHDEEEEDNTTVPTVKKTRNRRG